jgi:hypothetical protein
MLSKDEAVIFDCLFSTVICPVFFAEALADLSKTAGRTTPEKLVSDIADKTPVMHSYPNVSHHALLESELDGNKLDLRGVPHLAHGKFTFDSSGRKSIIYNESPEADAFSRWQDHKFQEVEKSFAAAWRESLSNAENGKLASIARAAFSISETPKNLEDAFNIASTVALMADQAETNLVLGCRILGLTNAVSNSAREHLISLGRPPLTEVFPYFVHCLKVELFFHIAVDKTLISPDRASNKIDITYLFYLPFCRFFVSNDKLHKRSAVLFLNAGQEFVDGAKLKADLQVMCAHYMLLAEEIEAEGIFRVAKLPPLGPDSLSTMLWQRASFGANEKTRTFESATSVEAARDSQSDDVGRPEVNSKLVSEIKERIESMKAGAPLKAGSGLSMDEIDQVAIERKIPLRRGRWRLLPKGIEKEKKG